MRTTTGFCDRGECDRCLTFTAGRLLTGTGWNWWCTCACHPEPVLRDEAHRPALDLWRRHRQEAVA